MEADECERGAGLLSGPLWAVCWSADLHTHGPHHSQPCVCRSALKTIIFVTKMLKLCWRMEKVMFKVTFA